MSEPAAEQAVPETPPQKASPTRLITFAEGILLGLVLGALGFVASIVYSPQATEPGVIEEVDYSENYRKGATIENYSVIGTTESGVSFRTNSERFYNYARGALPKPVVVTYSTWTNSVVELSTVGGSVTRESGDSTNAKFALFGAIAVMAVVTWRSLQVGYRASDVRLTLIYLAGALVVGAGLGVLFMFWLR